MAQVSIPIAASGDDAYIGGSAATWAGLTAGTVDTAGTWFNAAKTFDVSYFNNVCFMRFDTSTTNIPAGATVTGARLHLYPWNESEFDVDFRSFVAEYYAWTPGALSGTTDFTVTSSNTAHAGTLLGSIVINQYNNFELQNLGSINRSGYTGFRGHIDGGQPANYHSVAFYSYDNAANIPNLIVDYNLPTTRLAPDAILSQTNLTGTVSAIQDDPDTETGTWLTAP